MKIVKKSKYAGVVLLLVVFFYSFNSFAYIIPANQIIELMTDRYSSVKTLKIKQINHIVETGQEPKNSVENIIYAVSPDLHRSEIFGPMHKSIRINNGKISLSIVNGIINYSEGKSILPYYFIFMDQDNQRILNYLEDLGINTKKTTLTRHEGEISYLIGDRNDASPKLIVAKSSFLPLLLKDNSSLFIFSDYKDTMENNFYPHKVIHLHNGIKKEYTVRDISINLPLDLYLFDVSVIKNRSQKDISE